MSPFRSNRRGTLVIDLRFRRVGRLYKASGTDDPALLAQMKSAFRLLARRDGGRNLLSAVRDGRLSPMELFERFTRGQLDEIPDANALIPLTRLAEWAERASTGDDNRAARILAARRLSEHAPNDARVGALPDALRRYRDDCERQATAASFRLARAAACAFARDLFGKHSPLWNAVAAVSTLPRGKPVRRPMSVAQFREAVTKLKPEYAAIAWALAATGMGRREYWDTPWEELADRVLIHGTKRAGRERAVPRVTHVARPKRLYPAFRRAWAAAADGRRPYDLRRTFARWMQDAKIPRTRRRMYLGHGAQDVTDLYEAHEVSDFLRGDGARLRRLLGLERHTSKERTA